MVAKVKVKKKVGRKKSAGKVATSRVEKTVAKTLKNKAISQPTQRAGRTTTSRLSAKNQITIPVEILRKAGFKVGEDFGFSVKANGHISVYKLEPRILRLIGAGDGLFDDFDLEAERAAGWPE